ncbi:MAG: helix-turn-helix domain-containing protein [Idiomarina sp.]|nr:helix-turn-helix domain-containing protein [Idiomarina sp.]
MPDLSEAFSMQQLSAAITSKRTGMKLKLTDVAKALSLSKPTLVKIEKGDPNVTFINVLRVMEYLGLSFSIICDESNSERVSNLDEADDVWY